MSVHLPDVGNATIIGSGTTATAVVTTTVMGVINEYAIVIGLIVSLISLIVGVCFKISASRKEALRYEEELRHRALEAERSRQQLDALTVMVQSIAQSQQ